MKLFIILAVAACAHAAKLNRNYLPPSSAQTSGGSGNILETPRYEPSQRIDNLQRNYLPPVSGFQGPKETSYYQSGNFGQSGDNFGQSGNNFGQSGNSFGQSGNNFGQSGNNFGQSGNNFGQSAGNFGQSGNNFGQSGNNFGQSGSGFGQYDERAERPQAALERSAGILRLDSERDGDQYSYAYETENGIAAEESGAAAGGVRAHGGYSYTGDDGRTYSVRYTADENGFQPQGDHLPTPPPVPEEILRALEQNARDEAAGIYDDGSYNENKYDNNGYGQSNGYEQNNGNGNNGFENNDNAVVVNARYNDRPSFRNNGNNFKNNGNGFGSNGNGFESNGNNFRNNGNNLRSYLPPTY